jgi:beta-lactamase class A
MMRRASFLTGALAAVYARGDSVAAQFAALEASSGGRLGVFAVDTRTNRAISFRSDERFLMCSTFKFLAVAAVLTRVDRGADRLTRRVYFSKADLLAYAPIARRYGAQGYMTVGACCAAAIEYSDNTAANLLLRTIGGPPGFTRYARALGDPNTRLDRFEPALNDVIPGSNFDPTTPASMAGDMRKILLGDAVSPQSRARLVQWLLASQTGKNLLRAGMPVGWRVGDKTGLGGRVNAAGASDTRNDIAIVLPSGRAPLVIAAYLTGVRTAANERDAVLAHVGQIVSKAFSPD